MVLPYTTNTITGPYDSFVYANAVPLTQGEADLASYGPPAGGPSDPIAVMYGRAVVAAVLLQAVGSISAQTCYVVMQTSMDQSNWMDVAWLVSTLVTGKQLFWLSGGGEGASALQQTRNAGSAPGSNGSNAIPLGGSVRFIGSTTLGSSSSPSAGIPMIQATIRVKLFGLR